MISPQLINALHELLLLALLALLGMLRIAFSYRGQANKQRQQGLSREAKVTSDGNSVPNNRPSTRKTMKRTMFMASNA
jgi:hypothetical protein